MPKKGPIKARYNGKCSLCGKPYLKGDSLKHDGAYWSHAKCVNAYERQAAIQRNIDTNADAANSRRWVTG
jgi:hypothetical protein